MLPDFNLCKSRGLGIEDCSSCSSKLYLVAIGILLAVSNLQKKWLHANILTFTIPVCWLYQLTPNHSWKPLGMKYGTFYFFHLGEKFQPTSLYMYVHLWLHTGVIFLSVLHGGYVETKSRWCQNRNTESFVTLIYTVYIAPNEYIPMDSCTILRGKAICKDFAMKGRRLDKLPVPFVYSACMFKW